jgi:hypothetical protein
MGVYITIASASQTLVFKSATTALHGATSHAVTSNLVWPYAASGLLACDANEALQLTTSHASQVSGVVLYVTEEVPS